MSEMDLHPTVPLDDDVSSFPADEARLKTYLHASNQLEAFEVPRLVDTHSPHDRLYIAVFDGTGNNATNPSLPKTNVALIADQVIASDPNEIKVKAKYLQGPGTQGKFFARAVDGATGHTYSNRLEEMYLDLVDRANRWHTLDPDTRVHVAIIGFSRGGSQAAGFTNLLHERGIPDLTSR